MKEGIVQSLTTEIPIGEALQASKKALSYIQLSCEDGPLLQIAHEVVAKPAWDKLKVLYNPSGFSSVFILFNDFFKTKPENFKDIETYLNEVKRLVTELKAHTIELAPQLILY